MTSTPHSRAALAAALLCWSLAAGPALAQTPSPTGPASRAAVRLEALEGEYVTLGRTNLRQQPSQQGARLAQIDAGTRLRVTGKVADAPWYAVVGPDGRSGYVFADLLRPAADAAQQPAAAGDAVGSALTRRLDAMESSLNAIRDQLKAPADAMQSMAARQESLEKAVEGLRADIAGLRGAAAEAAGAAVAEADKPGGLIDRVLKLQEQIAAQIAEQKAEVGKLAERLDKTEEWLKPLGSWSEETWNRVRPEAESWSGWIWNRYSAVKGWLTEGWWWQQPAAPAVQPAPPAEPPAEPPAPAPASPSAGRTIMG
ncbi:SH3 domain-containing protein [Azospirillum thermophilum]|uniref:SH3b domain-containing protein n=1 Tax=Azospirillum thermophilum TaxID=2202148 RepID=A0A2S2CQY0_9PROT|nr:SH3 domain-containing protein [Azospirillum thermophilum]AWK86933.1 hypothetical protein DEW08_12455 [Azospirillum thermophilum]